MNNKAFVLMPFREEYREVYDEVYKKACNDNGFDCLRVDDISRPGSITRDIVEGIIEADVIIADLTGRNPNVFYELGIAHTIGRKTIMTAQSRQDVPFDIANYRVFIYDQSIAGSKKLHAALDASLKELKNVIVRHSNPVQAVLSERTLFGAKKKVPLLQIVNVAKLPKQLRECLDTEKVIYIDDIRKIDLFHAKERYHLGATSLAYLVNLVLRSEQYDDYEQIHNLVLRERLDLNNPRNRLLFIDNNGT